jgi:group II intron reverse transcriptase/maturase
MDGDGKSDRSVVPQKSANKAGAGKPAAEPMEGRERAEGNPREQNRRRTQCRERLQHALERIRKAVKQDRKSRLTSLWHHVCEIERLREAYYGINRKGAAGVDEQTWRDYGEELELNLKKLSERLCNGTYRASPVRRQYIPKSDGRQRPIGVPTLEDKIVQRATVEVLNVVYERDFKGFSYGFRPGRSAHNALDALYMALMKRRVNWVLDADIRGYFDHIDHEWLLRFIEHRIADKRVIRHIRKWLRAGVLEDGKWTQAEEGTPQGGSISPLLANIYLHYVFDLWIEQWRKKEASGEVIVVRYADDFIIGFQNKLEAERCLTALRERMAKFQLELHPGKTRLLEFGRYATKSRKQRGKGKPETFDFLGFTHICDRTRRNGKFIILRQSMRSRMQTKLRELREELRCRLNHPVRETGQWLRSVLNGYYRYHAVPRNLPALLSFYRRVGQLWHRTLERRSHKGRVDWRRLYRLLNRWLPIPRIMHPYPEHRLAVTT